MKYTDVGDAVGLPDQVDKLRIQRYLLKYEKEHPGEILFHRNMAREHLKDPKFATTSDKNAARRYLFELPEPVGVWLEQAYPLMFRSKKHTAWFCKHFPELMIPERY